MVSFEQRFYRLGRIDSKSVYRLHKRGNNFVYLVCKLCFADKRLNASAHLLLARAASTPAGTHSELEKVRAMWSDPAAAERAIRQGSLGEAEDSSQSDRRVARSLNAVGEAYFAAAEEKRIAEVEPLKFPVYVGPADRAAVLAHVQTKVKDWFVKKKGAIERVEPAYVSILDLKPVPPPVWVIARPAMIRAHSSSCVRTLGVSGCPVSPW